MLAAADIAISRKQFPQAEDLLQRVLKQNPQNVAAYRALASMALARGEPEAAAQRIRDGLVAVPNNQALQLFLADLQLQRNDVEGVRETLRSLDTAGLRHDLVDYLDSRRLLGEGRWLAAMRRLETIRPLLADLPAVVQQIDLMLAQCYEKLGQPDMELAVYRQALLRDPNLVAARIGEARALTALGRQSLAIESLLDLEAQPGRRQSARGAGHSQSIAATADQRAIGQAGRRSGLERSRKLARTVHRGPHDQRRAKVGGDRRIAGRARPGRRRARHLAGGAKAHPKDMGVWQSIWNLLQSRETPENLQKYLDVSFKQIGDFVPWRTAQGNLWLQTDGKLTPEHVATLEKNLDQFSPDQRNLFWSDMGSIYYRLRDYPNARRCWMKIAEASPEDLRAQQTLFDLAVEFNQADDMQASAETLRQMLGTNSSVYKYVLATQIMWSVRNDKHLEGATLDRARRLVSEARMVRSEWYDLARLNAEIDELDNKVDDAIAGYQRALELSPGRISAARRLVALLYDRGRLAEANQALKFVGQTTSSDVMDRIKSDILRRSGDSATALMMAKKAVDEKPDDPGNHVWYAQMLDGAGKPTEAEEQFRLAVEKQPKSGQNWLLLTNHLVATKQKPAAAALLEDIKRSVPEADQPMVLARYSELLGDAPQAEKSYLTMLSTSKEDLGLLQTIAGFYVRTNQSASAMKYLDQIINSDKAKDTGKRIDSVVWARRVKAQLLKANGDFDSLQQALKILQANAVEGKYLPDDSALIAGMLAERPEAESRQQAVRMLEQLQSQHTLSPEHQMLLAQLYEKSGQWTKAREQMLSLLARSGANVGYAAVFASWLLQHDETEDAVRWVERVVRVQPQSLEATQLRAQLLAKQGHPEQAVKLIDTWLADPLPRERVPHLAMFAAQLEALGLYDDAEKELRRLVTIEPRTSLSLAAFLGRHGSVEESFAMLEKARRSQLPVPIVSAAIATLRTRPEDAKEQYFQLVEKWIDGALKDNPGQLELEVQRAELYEQRGQIDQVIELYQNVLGRAQPESAAEGGGEEQPGLRVGLAAQECRRDQRSPSSDRRIAAGSRSLVRRARHTGDRLLFRGRFATSDQRISPGSGRRWRARPSISTWPWPNSKPAISSAPANPWLAPKSWGSIRAS